ncbi:MAG: beta-glucosidase [bacterium]|nr:beta-glucosidase [bacterium]
MFNSFFMGGFECSSHRHRSGQRLDLMALTGHDRHFAQDYDRLAAHGLYTARTGIRWHLVEPRPHVYDWSSVVPMIRAARERGIQLIWDVLHYGYPDDLDIFSASFVDRFRRLGRAFAQVLADEGETVPIICPVNEISFFAWAGGDAGFLNPYVSGRSFELKCQLVRAALEVTDAFWETAPDTRVIHCDPVVHIIPNPERMHEADEAEGYRTAQYQGWDLLSGRLMPQLGGDPKYLDVLGLNFYPNNEWVYKGDMIERDDPQYKPFRRICAEIYERYQRPMMVAETGAESERRAGWFRYVCAEVRAALAAGLPLHGICLYPIMSFPGWEDGRDCQNGLWGYAAPDGGRAIYPPLAQALADEQSAFVLYALHG